jgi:hypothetical protein
MVLSTRGRAPATRPGLFLAQTGITCHNGHMWINMTGAAVALPSGEELEPEDRIAVVVDGVSPATMTLSGERVHRAYPVVTIPEEMPGHRLIVSREVALLGLGRRDLYCLQDGKIIHFIHG